MYKKFLSLALLISMGHALSANELQASEADTNEIVETTIFNNLEAKEQEPEIAPETVEIQDEIASNSEVIAENPESAINEEITEKSVEVIEAVENKGEMVEEAVRVIAEATINEVTYAFALAPKAAELLNGLSPEALADLNDFGAALGKDLLALPEVQAFITKHLAMYVEYTSFKGECPRISVDFIMLGEEAMNEISSKLNEIDATFEATLSDENKLKFEEAREDLPRFLNIALGFTLSQIGTRKFPTELINLDKNQELMIIVRVD